MKTRTTPSSSSRLQTWKSWLQSLWIPVVSTTVFYAVWFFFARKLNALIPGKALLLDYLLQLAIAIVLFTAFRKTSAFVAAQAVLQFALYFAHLVKISVFGTPLVGHDSAAIVALLQVTWRLAPLQVVAAAVICLLLIGVAVRGLDWRRAWPAAICGVIAASILWVFPKVPATALDAVYGIDEGYQKVTAFKRRAPLLYSVGEIASLATKDIDPPTRAAVEHALQRLPAEPYSGRPTMTSIVLINMESFFVPAVADQQPGAAALAPSFRELWEASGRALSLSPVYGGQTAESEFELMCGLPGHLWSGIEFLRLGRRELPCLPQVLTNAGYRTIAIHPNYNGFWNRDNAYPSMGFSEYWADRTLEELDPNLGTGDGELFQSLAPELPQLLKQPTFLYVLSLGLHSPFKRDREAQPDVWTPQAPEFKDIARYSNSFHYSAEALVGFINEISRIDPNALVIAVGDHLPPLTRWFETTGRLGEEVETESPLQRIQRHATPLVVLRGGQPVSLAGLRSDRGDGSSPSHALLAHHLFPSRIARLIDVDFGVMGRAGEPPSGFLALQRSSVLVEDRDNAQAATCSTQLSGANSACDEASVWVEAVRVLGSDLLYGRGYALASR